MPVSTVSMSPVFVSGFNHVLMPFALLVEIESSGLIFYVCPGKKYHLASVAVVLSEGANCFL